MYTATSRVPKYYILADNGPAIEDELVWQVARYWLGIERICLDFLGSIWKEIRKDADIGTLMFRLERLDFEPNVTFRILEKTSSVMDGAPIHKDYLKQRNLLPF